MSVKNRYYFIAFFIHFSISSNAQKMPNNFSIYETSASGNKLTPIASNTKPSSNATSITIHPTKQYQTIEGFGGAFTQSSGYLLSKLSQKNRDKIIAAYFSEQGAHYSLTRTHINSCDFSLNQYSYAPIANDTLLQNFSIAVDKEYLIPMIKDAQKVAKNNFKIIASPWTSPPWMKDNNNWVGGKLLPQYRNTWALYFSKYLQAYKKEGIKIWGVTVENEPNGNGNNWESLLFAPKEMTDFVQDYLGPKLQQDGWGNIKILGYDQNRAELKNWVDEMYRDEKASKYFAGTAIHWYESTYEVYPNELQYAYQKNKQKLLIQTEACVDSEVPKWKDDNWYWSKEATDWGWDWASEKEKYLHPKYVPVFRYANDIIGCLNNYVNGWVDWNMVLNKQGGPNWFKNWCVAPIIVDEEKDEVYITPLYYTMAHFSKFIRPGAVRLGFENNDTELLVTAAKNKDGSIAVVIFNASDTAKSFSIKIKNQTVAATIAAKAIQTIVLKK
jgi:glucosylceramidase